MSSSSTQLTGIESKRQQEKLNVFACEISEWTRELVNLCHHMKKTSPRSEEEKQAWADDWCEKEDVLADKLDEIVNRVWLAEQFKEVDARASGEMIEKVIEVVKAVNLITTTMHGIKNHFEGRRLDEMIKRTEGRAAEMEHEHQKLLAQLAEKMKHYEEIQKTEEKQKSSVRTAEIIARAEKREQNEYERMLKDLEARRALEQERGVRDHQDESFEKTIKLNDTEDMTLVEDAARNRKKARRSRSFTRQILGNVKKSIRRSISAVNYYVNYDN